MKIRGFSLSFYCFIALVLVALGCGKSRLDVAEVVAQADPAVVLINAYDENDKPFSLGSGFIISTDGIVVTN